MPKLLFQREAILARLHAQVAAGRPILAAGSSCGLVAKCAAIGGADLLVVYSTGRSRLMGLPTSRIGDSNAATMGMAAEIRNVVRDVPMIGGVEAWDPTRMDLDELLEDFRSAGFSGIINYPTISTMGQTWRDRRERVGLGFDREVELVRRANAAGMFSMAYVATPEDARAMAEAGADCIVPHVGATRGGLVGHEAGQTGKADVAKVKAIMDGARSVRRDAIYLAHGGTISEPEDTESVYRETGCVGFVAASSIERIPIERAVSATARAFKAVPLGDAPTAQI